MGEPGSLVVLGVDEDLGLAGEAAERCGVQDPIPVTLEAGPPLVGLLLDRSVARSGSMGCSRAQQERFSVRPSF